MNTSATAVLQPARGENDIALRLARLRPQLLGFARLQLRDDILAEDMVQDTFITAIERADQFQARSSLRTWATSILKNKIIDHFRRRNREVLAADVGLDCTADPSNEQFDSNGRYRSMPEAWIASPEDSLSQQQFFLVLQACLEHLPPQIGRVFMMREWLGLTTDEICQELQITSSNCWVILYRARMGLRDCLNAHWFARPQA